MRKLTTREFHYIFKKTPRVTVDLVIKDRRGILLIKRDIRPDIGKWHFPGGTVYYKERILDAVKRKAREETGLQIKIKKLLGVFDIMRYREPGNTHIVDLIFLVRPIRGKLRGNKKFGGETLKFFKRLPKNMMIEHRQILQGRLIK
ncbi:MAG: NUDIX hydrolase [Candidatus Aenigmarchaeota archaeon]|nr:NUDIX hydrolase [Candidatus Aenigmarchaeota archaeon]